MRAELARAINRKKTPDLMFRIVLAEDVPPPSMSDADYGDDEEDEGDEG